MNPFKGHLVLKEAVREAFLKEVGDVGWGGPHLAKWLKYAEDGHEGQSEAPGSEPACLSFKGGVIGLL